MHFLLLFLPPLRKFFCPAFGIGIQIVKSRGGKPAAVFDIFAGDAVHEDGDLDIHKVSVADLTVGVAQFQQFSRGEGSQLLGGKKQTVGVAQHAVIFIVFADIIKKYIYKLFGIFGGKQFCIVKKASISSFSKSSATE